MITVSNNILELKKYCEVYGQDTTLAVTAYVNEEKDHMGTQITVNGEYFQLNKKELKQLINVLQKRYDRKKGYNATD